MADAMLAPILLQFAAAYGCMLVIPGPNTVLVLRACDGISARKPLLAAAGVATGAALSSLLAASSAAALPHAPGMRAVCGVIAAALLLRAAVQSSRSRRVATTLDGETTGAAVAPYLLGLGAALFNPVSVPYFASFFVSHDCDRVAAILTCTLVFAMAGLWFSSIGLISTRVGRLPVPEACRRALDWAIAATLVGFALRSLLIAVSL